MIKFWQPDYWKTFPWKKLLLPGLLAVSIFLFYLNSLPNPLFWDDHYLISVNTGCTLLPWGSGH